MHGHFLGTVTPAFLSTHFELSGMCDGRATISSRSLSRTREPQQLGCLNEERTTLSRTTLFRGRCK
eukprot:scaffold350_cov333-Pavlova_lutheri.AAC.23